MVVRSAISAVLARRTSPPSPLSAQQPVVRVGRHPVLHILTVRAKTTPKRWQDKARGAGGAGGGARTSGPCRAGSAG